MANTDPLIAGVKQYLSELSDSEFTDLVAEVREPSTDPAPDTDGVARGRERYAGK